MDKISKVQPTSRTEIAQLVNFEIDQFLEKYPQLATLQAAIHIMAEKVLSNLPAVITSFKILSINCNSATNDAVCNLNLAEDESNEAIKLVTKLRQELCSHVRFMLYSRHIEKVIAEICEYQQANKAVRWGIGTISNFGKGKPYTLLSTFINFWRENIEAKNDIFFRTKILLHLPLNWQKKYQPIDRCPHDWSKMKDEEIGKTIGELKPNKDPSKFKWSFAGLQQWVDDNGRKIGGMFYKFLRKGYGKEAELEFKTKILPHMPVEWQKNFVLKNTKGLKSRCPHHWHDLSPSEITSTLSQLNKQYHPTRSIWNLGSIGAWTGPNNERWGNSFLNYWNRKYKSSSREEFKKQVLINFPPEWQSTYCEIEYEITFIPAPPEIKALISQEYDLDKLAALAQNGYIEAFDKLVILATHFIDMQFPNMIISIANIERIVHRHRPAIGRFENHLVSAATQYFKSQSVTRVPMDAHLYYKDMRLSSRPDDGAVDFSKLIRSIEGLELPIKTIALLERKISEGKSLKDLVLNGDAEIAKASAAIMKLLKKN